MSACVVDASVAIKWVVPEPGSGEALALRHAFALAAPGLIVAECANILWKKRRLGQLSTDEADIAAHLLAQAELELIPTRNLLPAATAMAIELDHPAYDCIYLALALDRGWHFVTADSTLVRKLRAHDPAQFGDWLQPLIR